MPQLPVNSTNIKTFSFKVSFDVYNRTITFDASGTTYNGSGASNVKGIAFSLIDQVGVVLLFNTFPTTQIPTPASSSVFTFDASSIAFAFLFQNYKIIGSIQDQDGKIYSTAPIIATVCQPQNISDNGYVPGLFQITPDCVNSVLEIKERTLMVLSNQQPQSVSKSGTLNYPAGTISPVAFSATPFTNNVVYTGQYRIVCTTVATYALANDVYILVSYVTNNIFDVTCANKIADLMCCIIEVQREYEKNCNNAKGQAALQLLKEISVPFMVGLSMEISGMDAGDQARLIKKILNCNCGDNSLSQSEFTPINPSVNSIVLQGVGGTTIPSPTITGNTKTYNIASNTYLVGKGNTGDLAFTIAVNTNVANTVQYLITFNYDVMAGYILSAIGADPSLLAQLNALVGSAGVDLSGLNGGCVIDLTTTTYSLSQNVTIATGILNIVINGTVYNAPSGLLAINVASVNTWLTSLGLGSFSTSVVGGVLSIFSVGNTNKLATMTFTTPNTTVAFASTNKSLKDILQAMINWMCNLTSLQVALANSVTICSLDYNGELVKTAVSSTQDAFNQNAANAICSIVNRMLTLTGLTCAQIQALFQTYPNYVFDPSADTILAILGGNCSRMSAQQAVLGIIATVNSFANVKAAWCAIDCNSVPTCPDIANSNLGQLSPTSIGVYGVSFVTPTQASQTLTVKYRVTGSGLPYIISNNNLVVLPNGNVSNSPPFVITGLVAATQYDILIQNNCGGSGFVKTFTTPSGSLFQNSYLLANVLYNTCAASPVQLYSSVPFGPGVTMYTDAGLSMPATGFTFIAQATNGAIFAMNSGTGVVGVATGNMCTSGISGNYILGNSTGSVCSGSVVTRYTNGPFAVGSVLYVDSGLTTPVTGSSYVVAPNGTIYNLNSSNGVIGVSTGLSCNNTQAISIRLISGASYWTNRTAACAAKAGGCGFGTGTIYVRNADLASYLSGVPVTGYQDALGTVIYQDFSIPINTTKERMLFISDCVPNIWQTDNNNNVSIKQESAC